MLSYKNWKTLEENYDFSLGMAIPSTVGSFEELLEAKKKMKKKMLGDEEIEADVEEPEEEEDAETGDGEVVEPTAPKDKVPVDDEEEAPEEEDDEEVPSDEDPLLVSMKKKMKKMKSKMKKKMSADTKKENIAASSTVAEINSDDAWLKSVRSMLGSYDPRNDGLTDYTNEDALLPVIDINTGLVVKSNEPGPGEVGFAPQSRFGL